ncbi:MAG: hypothetical protein GX306_10255 [Clostridiales bacterium]|jgi:pentatricopeptide repeat protein|nr:hypothetical protein [Clostridiales bacterium]
MEFKLILYHYYMQIYFVTEGYPIAEVLYDYHRKKHGPNSELTDYAAYLLIHAYQRSGQFHEAYEFFQNIYEAFKTNQPF